VWRVSNGELNIRALTGTRGGGLYEARGRPYWNLSDDGRVCTGTMRRPDSASVGAIYPGSAASTRAHSRTQVGRLTRHEGGFEALWTGLAGKRQRFRSKHLSSCLRRDAVVRGERPKMASNISFLATWSVSGRCVS